MQNHQQPGQRFPVEVVSVKQQGGQLGAAPAIGGAAHLVTIQTASSHEMNR